MLVALTELKTNPGKYVALEDRQDVYITRNGKRIARITSAKPDKRLSAKAMLGILPADVDLAEAREERYTGYITAN